MKIYAVSDLHGNLDGLDPCDADLVVIAGDLAPMKGWGVWHVNDQVKWINRKFSAWCEKYPKTEFVVIPGNHDLFAQRDDVPTKVVWPVNVHFIVDRVAEVKTSSPSHSNSTMTLRRKRGRGFTSTESLLSRAQ